MECDQDAVHAPGQLAGVEAAQRLPAADTGGAVRAAGRGQRYILGAQHANAAGLHEEPVCTKDKTGTSDQTGTHKER